MIAKHFIMSPTVVPLLITLILAAGCTGRPERKRSILPPTCRLEPGDIVFRRGAGMTSHAVLIAQNDGIYSHVGIVADSAGQILVVHAVPGEPDFKGDPDRVKADRPETFFDSQRAIAGAVMRCPDRTAARRAASAAWNLYQRGVTFDHEYDETDTLAMYCTELVSHVYRRAGRPIVGPGRHRISLPGLSTCCLLPSDLLESPELTDIARF